MANKDIKINKTFEKKFTKSHQKRELSHKNSLLNAAESDYYSQSGSSESEDNDARLLTSELDTKVNNLIRMIRSNDPTLRQIGSDYYENGAEPEPNGVKAKTKKTRVAKQKTKLKDVMVEQILEENKQKSLNEKIEKNEKIQKIGNKETENGFLFKKDDESKSDEDFFEKVFSNETGSQGVVINSEAKKTSKNKEANDFLDRYFENEYWKGEKDNNNLPIFKKMGNTEMVFDDEADIDRQDRFESEYNFRFQEPQGTKLITYSRNQPDSVRKKASARKKNREEKTKQKEIEKKAKTEELKKLKQTRRKEITKRLKAIKTIAGDESLALTAEDLEADFDGQKFALRMDSLFGANYYARPDQAAAEGTTAADADCPRPNERKGLKSRQKELAASFAKIEADLNAAEKADFDALYGGAQSDEEKFAYVRVKPKSYGLTAAEILAAEDKALTRRISIKFLAPYRDDEDGEKWRRKSGGAEQDGAKKEGNKKTANVHHNRFVESATIVKREMRRQKYGKRDKKN